MTSLPRTNVCLGLELLLTVVVPLGTSFSVMVKRLARDVPRV
jgi:hypothetical protein